MPAQNNPSTLIATIDQLKQNFAGIDANFNWDSISSFVQDVERDILQDLLGAQTLAYFSGIANPTDANPPPLELKSADKQILVLLQRTEAYLTILKWSQTALFRLTDKALYVAKSSDGVIISDKKLRDLRNYCEESGFNYLDKAISLLEDNLKDYFDYASSVGRQALLQGFLKTAADFNRQRSIDNSRLTFISMNALMLDAQEEFLPDIMGQDFYDDFKANYLADNQSDDELVLMPLLKKAIAFLTVSKACNELPVKITSRGLLINKYNDTREYDQADPADAARIQFMSDDFLDKGRRKLNDLQQLIIRNAANYPLYVLPDTTPVTENDDPCSGFYSM